MSRINPTRPSPRMAPPAIPGVFPPVMIDVAIDGKLYQEMHVDGGAIAQAFLYPPSFNLKAKMKELGVKNARPAAYIIRNARLYRPEEKVERQTLKIAHHHDRVQRCQRPLSHVPHHTARRRRL